MRGADDDTLRTEPEAFPDGKVRRRLEQFTSERGLQAEDSAPTRPSVAAPTVAFAAGLAATGARMGVTALPALAEALDGEGRAELAAASAEARATDLVAGGAADVEVTDVEGVDADETWGARAGDDLPPEVRELAGPAGVAAARRAARWRSIGPTYMPHGQTYGTGGDNRVDVAGRVSAVAVDPSDRDHVLVGAAGGGIWETTDQGATWAPRTDSMPSLATGAVAFDPSNPAIVYAGTGEGDFYASLGAGVLRSTDGGRTWSVQATAPFLGVGFHDLTVDPSDGTRILAATRNGIYESRDSAATWQRRRAATAWTISRGADEVLAATAGGVVRSTDGGTTWSAVTLPSAPASWVRIAVRHAPSDPGTAYVFASGADGADRKAVLWRRGSAGGAWARVGLPSGLNVGQSWYDWFLGVSPANPDLVFLGAINVWRGLRVRNRFFWTNISARSSGDSIHPDQHCIAFDPTQPSTLYVGNDGGLYRSPDDGGTWEPRNQGLAITEIEYLAQDLGNCRFLLGGTQDNGSIRYTGSPVWEHVQDGDGGDCGVVDDDPAVAYHSFYNMGLERSTTGGGWGSWSWRGPNVPEGYQSLFYPPQDTSFSTVAQAGQSMYVSRNRAGSFTEVALPGDGIATAMHAASADLIYLGMSDGRVARATWSGSGWVVTELTRPRAGAAVSDVHVSADGSRLYATYRQLGGGRAFGSTDDGGSWSDVTSNLPPVAVNAVVVDPADRNRIWVGCDVGVYESRTSGGSWHELALGLPNALVGDLLFSPDARLLRAGTRNRGVWEVDVDGPLRSPICGVQFRGSVAANQTRRYFTFNWPSTWHVVWTVMPTTPHSGAPQLTWNVEVERADSRRTTYWISVTNLTDTTTAFEGRYAILSRC